MSKARGVPGPGIVEGDGMTRAVRWLVVVVAAAATFGVCVWVVRAVPWGWLPQGEGPRLDTALAFGAVTAAGVLAAGGWWAARDRTPPAPAPVPARVVTQEATASGNGQVTQVGGSRRPAGAPADGSPSRVEQHAEASDDGSILQAGGHLNPTPGTSTDGIPSQVEQRAKASGHGRVVQAGGDQHVEGA
ncbi:hypothetical protein OG462_27905 [Streptomyces sp. NBC_01077]|uniref:hypothetical protein n=1 Tax=Streptomyces sp. NBC_01077 TaxID=2903746 RepID=UPI0038663C41|nr:hypothetical protein OG462_27905 [Streptomyces sp. NBC_01077]